MEAFLFQNPSLDAGIEELTYSICFMSTRSDGSSGPAAFP